MTETPGRSSDPAPEQNSDATTEPTPVATSVPVAEDTGTAPDAGKPRVRWRWPEKTRNRIAASVAIAAGAVAVVAAIFMSGVVVGAHSYGDNHNRLGPQISAQREGTPAEQIWIIPGGSDGYIVAGSVATDYEQP
jgi:hypothetical protein